MGRSPRLILFHRRRTTPRSRAGWPPRSETQHDMYPVQAGFSDPMFPATQFLEHLWQLSHRRRQRQPGHPQRYQQRSDPSEHSRI